MVAKKDSPSLSARSSKASDGDEPKPIKASAAKQINDLSDLEPVRFSRRQDLEKHDSPIGKIVVYIIVVIVVGVGLTLLVQNYVSNQNAANTNTPPSAETPESEPDVVIPNATISKATLADSAATRVTKNELYTISDLSLGSAGNDVSAVKISALKHDVYSTFTRTSWTLDGLKGGLPASKISYNNTDKTVTIQFNGVKEVDAGFLQEIKVKVGNVVTITGVKDSAGVTFVLKLGATSKYYAFIDNGNIVSLDIKTDANLNQPSPTASPAPTPTPTPTPAPVPPPAADGDAPAAPHYDNVMSQNKQYVSSNATGTSVFNETYYYVDYGDSFQFSWAMRGVGDNAIPNASAELKSEGTNFFIEILIHNLGQDLLAALGKTKPTVSINTDSTNFKDLELKSFTGGTSTYKLSLKHKGDFRLHSTQTYEGHQLLGIQLKD